MINKSSSFFILAVIMSVFCVGSVFDLIIVGFESIGMSDEHVLNQYGMTLICSFIGAISSMFIIFILARDME